MKNVKNTPASSAKRASRVQVPLERTIPASAAYEEEEDGGSIAALASQLNASSMSSTENVEEEEQIIEAVEQIDASSTQQGPREVERMISPSPAKNPNLQRQKMEPMVFDISPPKTARGSLSCDERPTTGGGPRG